MKFSVVTAIVSLCVLQLVGATSAGYYDEDNDGGNKCMNRAPKDPRPAFDLNGAIGIWSTDFNPKNFHAPIGTRIFRKKITTPKRRGMCAVKARIIAFADDSLKFYVNGKVVGEAALQKKPVVTSFDAVLNPSENVFLIEGLNHPKHRGAGLVAAKILVEYSNGEREFFTTGLDWRVCPDTETVTAEMSTPTFDDSKWGPPGDAKLSRYGAGVTRVQA
ncbi:hypothetical protein HGRIS_012967 [Hohenbuehelia grisea]|uniref:Lectin n=1 Tax=Hohenbuehelia grisea TaxID=104357 RepID=A0ABR3IU81_9AGAR